MSAASVRKTHGFGVPDEMDPHHFTVEIPAARNRSVIITEHFGLSGGRGGPEAIERVRVPRAAWAAIAEEAKRVLNRRLKEKDIKGSRWSTGKNVVERLLGRELTVLAWGVEAARADRVGNAIRNWVALRPEERWWLFSMGAAMTGTSDDREIGWRKAIRIALTENPTGEEVKSIRSSRPRIADEAVELPLFGKP